MKIAWPGPGRADEIARCIRGRIVETSHRANVPHLGSCLSCVDILTVLYWGVLDVNPADPSRDRFILSKGHAAPAFYQVLAKRGFFPETLLDRYGEDGSLFGEHPPAKGIPGVEAATGSLGHGLPIGVGIAIASRICRLGTRTFVLVSDGECNEGSLWEAAMLAAAQKLDRLAVIVDFNKWQATGRSTEIMALAPLGEKWASFGWSVCEIDGHDMKELERVLRKVPDGTGKPVAIVAHTVKGKGISFMEDDNNWHYRIPTLEEVETARKELGL